MSWGTKLAATGRALREKWTDVSFEKKLGMFVAPVFVTVLSAVLIGLLSGGGDSDPTLMTSVVRPSSGGLEVVSLAVRDANEDTTIEVTLRNIGSSVAVANRVRFRVDEFRTVGTCLPQAYLIPSHTYDLVLPDKKARGQLRDVDISQELAPNNADRFAFRVGVGDGDLISTTSYLYRLELLLFHDGRREPIRAGMVILGKPFPDEGWFTQGGDRDVRRCVEENRVNLSAVFTPRATASPAMVALTRIAGAS